MKKNRNTQSLPKIDAKHGNNMAIGPEIESARSNGHGSDTEQQSVASRPRKLSPIRK